MAALWSMVQRPYLSVSVVYVDINGFLQSNVAQLATHVLNVRELERDGMNKKTLGNIILFVGKHGRGYPSVLLIVDAAKALTYWLRWEEEHKEEDYSAAKRLYNYIRKDIKVLAQNYVNRRRRPRPKCSSCCTP